MDSVIAAVVRRSFPPAAEARSTAVTRSKVYGWVLSPKIAGRYAIGHRFLSALEVLEVYERCHVTASPDLVEHTGHAIRKYVTACEKRPSIGTCESMRECIALQSVSVEILKTGGRAVRSSLALFLHNRGSWPRFIGNLAQFVR